MMRLAAPKVPTSGKQQCCGFVVGGSAGHGVCTYNRRSTLGCRRGPSPISKCRRPSTQTGSLWPQPDWKRSRKNDAQIDGGMDGVEATQTEQKARDKSGEKENGFARLPRCRPAESDLARSARKSKKSYWATVPPFKMSAGAALSPETQGLPERGLGVSDELGTRHASSPGTSQSPGAGEQRVGPRGV